MTLATFSIAESFLNSSTVDSRTTPGIHNGYIVKQENSLVVKKREGYSRNMATTNTVSSIYTAQGLNGVYNLQSVGGTTTLFENVTSLGSVNNLVSWGAISWGHNEDYILIIPHGVRIAGTQAYTYKYTPATGISAVSDADFPLNASSNAYLACGVVFLDGYFFVGTYYDSLSPSIQGRIYNSAINNPTSWASTDYIAVNSNTGRLVNIAKHNNHLVAFTTSSIEFFYNAGNPSGSPLAKRLDIMYSNIGAVSFNSTVKSISPIINYKDNLYFIGQTPNTVLVDTTDIQNTAIYKIENFKLSKISSPTIDYLLKTSLSAPRLVGTFAINGKGFLILQGIASGQTTSYVYDIELGVWYSWSLGQIRSIALNYFSKTSLGQPMAGVYFFGEDVSGNLIYQDTIDNTSSTSDYEHYVQTPIIDTVKELEIKNRETTGNRKVCNSLQLLGYQSSATININVSYTDDHFQTFSTARTLDISNPRNKLTRLGEFTRRSFKFSYTGSSALILDKMVLDIT